MDLRSLNGLSEDDAAREFRRCCGSARWAQRMVAARPFTSIDAMAASGDSIWSALERADWLEAFAAHPPIGAGGAGRAGGDETWSAAEQSGVSSATAEVLARMAEANREYEARFGYIFIVCATGKTAEEMLGLLERRLENDPAIELRIAAGEQRKITRLRIEKLLDAHATITTHVLDTARGKPAAGVAVALERMQDNEWVRAGGGVTDTNGRLTSLTENQPATSGRYRLTFDVAGYQRTQGSAESFFPEVTVTFVVGDRQHYHVPLLLSPFGYSTYRGS